MLRKIVIPTQNTYLLNLPDNYVGKTVEVIAFEIDETKSAKSKEERLKEIEELTKNSRVDLSKFKFNRNEANNYDE